MPFDPALRARYAPFLAHDRRALLTDPELQRAWEEAFCQREGYEPPDVPVTDHEVEGPIGPFRVRTYGEAGGGGVAEATGPVLVWAHGGGFFAGSIDMVEGDVLSRELVTRGGPGTVVVAVDYHLANGGDVTYPTLHREVVAAVEWTRRRFPDAAGAGRLALGGGSAGGNLALAAALELRDTGRPLPDRLLIVYPALHRELLVAPDVAAELATLPSSMLVDQRMYDGMFRVYAGAAEDTSLLAPGDVDDLQGLPPCLVILGEYDPMRTSGERFVAGARAAGVEVAEYLARGMPHGHLNMTPNVPEVGATLDVVVPFLRGG
jgi:acetyl esterase/lipase